MQYCTTPTIRYCKRVRYFKKFRAIIIAQYGASRLLRTTAVSITSTRLLVHCATDTADSHHRHIGSRGPNIFCGFQSQKKHFLMFAAKVQVQVRVHVHFLLLAMLERAHVIVLVRYRSF